jgi:hypothetical protein
MSWALASACVCYGESCPGDLGAGPSPARSSCVCIYVCPPYVIFMLWRLGVCGVCVNSFIHCGRDGVLVKILIVQVKAHWRQPVALSGSTVSTSGP